MIYIRKHGNEDVEKKDIWEEEVYPHDHQSNLESMLFRASRLSALRVYAVVKWTCWFFDWKNIFETELSTT